ncbi:MAG: ankyrin repeat domain-containing protein [Candidatus Xenobiia bacterium LiM19]
MKKPICMLVLFMFLMSFASVCAQNQQYQDPYNGAEIQRFVRMLEDGDLTRVKEYLETNSYIVSPGWSRTSVLYAVKGGNIEIVKLLIEKGADVSAATNGYTALHEAAKLGHKEIAELLITKGADVNAKTLPLNVPGDLASAYTPLHLAAESGKIEVVKVLVSNKADVNARDSQGKTPLSYAQDKNQREVIEYLRSAGAKQ